MLFNVEQDRGDRIDGYLVPDTFSGRAKLIVRSAGIDRLALETAEERDALVSAGRHETGLCGFSITEETLPGLSELVDLELREAESGIVIYRRYDPDAVVQAKVFRLETHLYPLSLLDRSLCERFQFHFAQIERHGLETTNQMLLMNSTNSVYASGRLAYKSIEYYLDQGYATVALLHDPYDELAERLLMLRLLGQGKGMTLSKRDDLALKGAIEFASELPLEDEKGLRSFFRSLEIETISAVVDPLVRQLTKRLPDEAVTPSAISQALGTLSNFSVIGLRTQPERFAEDFATFLGLPAGEIPVVSIAPSVSELSERLRACPPVERILEHDLGLYHEIVGAFKKSLPPG